jgi:cell division protein FtsA
MSAIRLEVETHIVTASATAVQNLAKCVTQAGIRVDELVASSLAAAEAILTDTERDLGVAVADIGAGTTDLALFLDGYPFHTAVLPIGGNNVTNDLAIGLKTSLSAAEDVKIRFGSADVRAVDSDEEIIVEVLGTDHGRTISRADACDIIEARMRELFEKLGEEIARAGHGGMLPAGVVLTGGASQLAGIAELGREVMKMPVRVAAPSGIGGLVDYLLTPTFSTPIGLLIWGARTVMSQEPGRYDSSPSRGGVGRVRSWVRGLFP